MTTEPAHLTIEQAYKAMVVFLEREYATTNSDDIGSLLGSMQVLKDGSTADPAIAHHWWRAIEEAINNGK